MRSCRGKWTKRLSVAAGSRGSFTSWCVLLTSPLPFPFQLHRFVPARFATDPPFPPYPFSQSHLIERFCRADAAARAAAEAGPSVEHHSGNHMRALGKRREVPVEQMGLRARLRYAGRY